jgi:DinB superfamily
MHPDLKLLQSELDRALAGLDDHQTQLRPCSDSQADPQRWNIQQIVGHLLLTYGATVAAMDARIAKHAPTKARPSFPQRIGQFAVLHLGWLPHGRKAPAIATPDPDAAPVSGAALQAAAAAGIATMAARITAAEALFGNRSRAISHMILGPLSVPQWCRFHLVHGRHHLRQIAAIRAAYRL